MILELFTPLSLGSYREIKRIRSKELRLENQKYKINMKIVLRLIQDFIFKEKLKWNKKARLG